MCKNSSRQRVPAGTSLPSPAHTAGPVPPAEKRHQREASSASGHFIPQDITGYLSRRSRSVLVLRKVCTFEIGGQFLPGHGHRGVSAAQAREANSSSARRPRSRTRGRPARAQPGMHALWSRAESGAPAAVPRGPGPPHTDSSVDSSSGLMYSNPSNSDWSILLMTSLQARRAQARWDPAPRGEGPTSGPHTRLRLPAAQDPQPRPRPHGRLRPRPRSSSPPPPSWEAPPPPRPAAQDPIPNSSPPNPARDSTPTAQDPPPPDPAGAPPTPCPLRLRVGPRGSGPPPGRVLLVIRGQLHRLAGELRVEVVQAVVVGDLRLEGREGLLLPQLEGRRPVRPAAPSSILGTIPFFSWLLTAPLRHNEVPGPEVESELPLRPAPQAPHHQIQAASRPVATPDPSPAEEARTHIPQTDTVCFLTP